MIGLQKMSSTLHRRDVLCLATATAAGMVGGRLVRAETAEPGRSIETAGSARVALALGGGAARGMAHIPVLEAFDELGVQPAVIAGTSIGSIMGACYASGMSGKELRQFALELFEKRSELLRRMFAAPSGSWSSVFQFSTSALIKPDQLFKLILPANLPGSFGELKIPLKVVATDFFEQSQIVFEGGPLLPAIGASCALPGLLSPVRHAGRLLIDGGFVNPTPSDIIEDAAQYIVAVDLTGHQVRPSSSLPNALEMLTGATQIALHTIARNKLAHRPPNLLVTPDVQMFDSMDFYKTKEILAAAGPTKDEVKRGLDRILNVKDEPVVPK